MTQFVKADDGSFLSVAEIRKLVKDGSGSRALLASDKWVNLSDIPDCIIRAASQTIPAQPGFELLCAWFQDDGTICMERTPIVAWRIAEWGMAMPVLPEEKGVRREGNSGLEAIRFPDGQVYRPGDRRFKGEEAWTEYANQWAARRRQRAA